MSYLKNIETEKVLELSKLVDYKNGQVVSCTLAQNEAVSVTLFAFAKGEGLSTHSSQGDAMVTILEGSARITVNGTEHFLKKDQTIVMPAKAPHAVYAEDNFKMLLTVVFPSSAE